MDFERESRPTILVKRFPVAHLSDLVYGEEPMPAELAETIRRLRRESRLSYDQVMWALCESEPDFSACVGYGKALVELACLKLNDFDPNWK